MGKAKDDCRQSGCPVAYCLDLFGDRWSLLVVRDMILVGKRHFGEFLESPERIASNILANRLKRLEEAGVITRTLGPDNQKQFIYALTSRGLDLIPLILDALVWGAKHSPSPPQAKELAGRITKERDAVIGEIIASIKENRPYLHVPSEKTGKLRN
jgi:DNA-binding HxlR family transcriptional regulator